MKRADGGVVGGAVSGSVSTTGRHGLQQLYHKRSIMAPPPHPPPPPPPQPPKTSPSHPPSLRLGRVPLAGAHSSDRPRWAWRRIISCPITISFSGLFHLFFLLFFFFFLCWTPTHPPRHGTRGWPGSSESAARWKTGRPRGWQRSCSVAVFNAVFLPRYCATLAAGCCCCCLFLAARRVKVRGLCRRFVRFIIFTFLCCSVKTRTSD